MQIIYIDDQEAQRRAVKRQFLLSPGIQDVASLQTLSPEYTLDDTYKKIKDQGEVAAVITDYHLTEALDVNFTGAELVQFLINKSPFLPCFVLTSFEEDALRSDAIDVYHVYEKSLILGAIEHQHVPFFKRVVEQIEKSRKKLRHTEEDYEELRQQQGDRDWTSEKEERLLECDDYLERHYGESRVPRVLKKDSSKIIELIAVTKELLQEARRR